MLLSGLVSELAWLITGHDLGPPSQGDTTLCDLGLPISVVHLTMHYNTA